MTVMIVLDLSASLECATHGGTKAWRAAEIAALLAFAAGRSNDRVGLLTFSDRIEHYLPPAKGPRQAQRLVAELQRQVPAGRGTDLAAALNFLNRVQRRGAILFLISDFLADDYFLPLVALARRHDVVAISVDDPLDHKLPAVGLLQVADAETGARRLIDCGDAAVRAAYRNHASERQTGIGQVLSKAGVERLLVASDSAPVKALAHFFHSRRRGR